MGPPNPPSNEKKRVIFENYAFTIRSFIIFFLRRRNPIILIEIVIKMVYLRFFIINTNL